MRSSNDIPAAESAIFVVNKWDTLVSNTLKKPEERSKFLDLIKEGLQRRWRGFKEDQLVTLNSKNAAELQEVGQTPADMKLLCDSVNTMLPRGMDNLLRRSIKYEQIIHVYKICWDLIKMCKA